MEDKYTHYYFKIVKQHDISLLLIELVTNFSYLPLCASLDIDAAQLNHGSLELIVESEAQQSP